MISRNQSRNQGNCSILVGQELKQCEVMLQLKPFLFEIYRDEQCSSYFLKATEVTEEPTNKSRSYVTSFTRTILTDEFHHLTSSMTSSTTYQEKCNELLHLAVLVPCVGPSGRINNKGNLALSFDTQVVGCSSFLFAKVSRRICNTLYIIEVVAEVDEDMTNDYDAQSSFPCTGENGGDILATQPYGACDVLVRFKLYDPLSSLVLQTAAPLTLCHILDDRRRQIYSAMERLYVVESKDGKAAVLRYTSNPLSLSLTTAPHSFIKTPQACQVPLTIGLSCREGKSDPLLLIHASVNDEVGGCHLSPDSKFLFHPLITLPPLDRNTYIDDANNSNESLFEPLHAVIDDLCIVMEPSKQLKGKVEWQLWHPAQSHEMKVSHFSRRVQTARALDYSLNKDSTTAAII